MAEIFVLEGKEEERRAGGTRKKEGARGRHAATKTRAKCIQLESLKSFEDFTDTLYSLESFNSTFDFSISIGRFLFIYVTYSYIYFT